MGLEALSTTWNSCLQPNLLLRILTREKSLHAENIGAVEPYEYFTCDLSFSIEAVFHRLRREAALSITYFNLRYCARIL